MLKSLFCAALLFVLSGTLSANEAACRNALKIFWNSFAVLDVQALKHITSDFKAVSGAKTTSRTEIEGYLRTYKQYRDLVKKGKYDQAAEAFAKLLAAAGRLKRTDHRSFAELSEKEREQSIAFMKKSLTVDKYTLLKKQSMKIKQITKNGSRAAAVISYQDFNKESFAEIEMKKQKGKWLVSKITKK